MATFGCNFNQKVNNLPFNLKEIKIIQTKIYLLKNYFCLQGSKTMIIKKYLCKISKIYKLQ